MRKDLGEQFNCEVDNYRRALLYYARAREWEEFEARAGRMFDYIESIEFSELKRRFLQIFTPILVLLVMAVMALLGFDFASDEALVRLKNLFVLVALGASGFELYFFLDYREYTNIRAANSRRRREVFIRNIEHDFRAYAAQM